MRTYNAPLGVVLSTSSCIATERGAYARTLAGTSCQSCLKSRPSTAPMGKAARSYLAVQVSGCRRAYCRMAVSISQHTSSK